MTPTAGRRRWLQFGLKSLLLLTVICAVAITWWRQWKQSAELAELAAVQEKLQWLEIQSEKQDDINRVFRALDLENPEHRNAFKVLRYMSAGWPLDEIQKKPVGEKSRLEVLLFHSDTHSEPGSVDSVAVLLRDHELVDVLIRESSTRTEWHDAKLEDTDDDGNVEVVFDCRPGMWSDSKPFTIAYGISNSGFAKIE